MFIQLLLFIHTMSAYTQNVLGKCVQINFLELFIFVLNLSRVINFYLFNKHKTRIKFVFYQFPEIRGLSSKFSRKRHFNVTYTNIPNQ